jgi:ATP phosphoribosyltransferase regulatory subunit
MTRLWRSPARCSKPPAARRSIPDYVLPADIPLELSGEAVRARLCVFTDNRGAEMAMRPDLTLPVAQREAARLEGGPVCQDLYLCGARLPPAGRAG